MENSARDLDLCHNMMLMVQMQSHSSHPSGTGPLTGVATPSGAQIAVDRAISDLRRGGMVILRDPEHRSSVIVQAAEMVTSEGLRMLVQLTGSQPTVAITRNRAVAIRMATTETSVVSVVLPVGVDAAVVHRIADPTWRGDDPEPGTSGLHLDLAALSVIPERENGLAHSAVQLVKFARLLPSVLFARAAAVDVDRQSAMGRETGLLSVETSQVQAFQGLRAHRLVRAASAPIPLRDAEDARFVAFRPLDGGEEHVAIIIGDLDTSRPVLVRLHSQCLTGDLLGSLRCDCGDQLRGAIREIARAGSGVLVYLAQEGRDIGLINKLKAYTLQDLGVDTVDANEHLGFDADERVYVPAAEILRQLDIGSVRLLTNNPDKVGQLAATDVRVVDRVSHVFPSNRHNEHYLRTKAARTGHLL